MSQVYTPSAKVEAGIPLPQVPQVPQPQSPPPEIGGRKGPEPTRYGDWEKNGRCIDF